MRDYRRMQTDEVVAYWRGIVGTLDQRGLLEERPRMGGKVLPTADAILLPDRVIFALDLQRLGGISREDWLDDNLWKQWRAALQGRHCFVSDGGGLAITVAREPGLERKRLPAAIHLTPDRILPEPYHVCLGFAHRGPVHLDLAGKHRAILVGGTTGAGKTNLMQSAILQLAAKHTPAEVHFAIVDTKEVDFGRDYERLPHLFVPIAHDLADAARLIERVENERLRRQAVMAAAGVADWRKVDGLPLLLLVVDEAADFARTATMDTLVDIARKGRAFGLSIILGTQSPSAKVIHPQIRANLPTAIAFQTRTDVESRVILGRKGAEALNRPGLALTFVDGRWAKVQTLEAGAASDFISERVAVDRPALTDVEQALVRYAVRELDGAFKINQLYQAHKGQISQRRLTALAQTWEERGWLTEPRHATDPRRVTDELLTLAGPAPTGDTERDDRVIGVIGGDRDAGVMIGEELPPFLRRRKKRQADKECEICF